MLQVPGIDGSLNFKPHVLNPARKWEVEGSGKKEAETGFLSSKQIVFLFKCKKVHYCCYFFFFLPVLEHGDLLYMYGSAQCLHMTNNVYHS